MTCPICAMIAEFETKTARDGAIIGMAWALTLQDELEEQLRKRLSSIEKIIIGTMSPTYRATFIEKYVENLLCSDCSASLNKLAGPDLKLVRGEKV